MENINTMENLSLCQKEDFSRVVIAVSLRTVEMSDKKIA
jgi:hypothetical protein